MIPEACQNTIDALTSVIREQVMEGKPIPPCVFFGKKDKPTIPLPIDCSSNSAKDASALMIRMFAKNAQPDFIIHVSEAWMVTHLKSMEEVKKYKEQYPDLEQAPDREEVVMLSLETKMGRWLGCSPIKVVDGKRTFDDFKMEMSGRFEGRFTGFMPRPDTPTH